jgi:hypothetical protein
MMNWLLQIPTPIAIWCVITMIYATCLWGWVIKDFIGAICVGSRGSSSR